jgi:hypothetical protein
MLRNQKGFSHIGWLNHSPTILAGTNARSHQYLHIVTGIVGYPAELLITVSNAATPGMMPLGPPL